MRSVLLAAGISALVGVAISPAPAAAGCVYDPGGYRGASYYWTNGSGNDPDVYENGTCDIFDMSRGNLNPSYQNWRGWLYEGGNNWYTNGWHPDDTVGVGVLLESAVAYQTREHAHVNNNEQWRNQEYH